MTYDVHFSKSGWINANGEYALIGASHSDRRIEAIRINIYAQNADIEYGVYVDKVGWKNGKNGQIAGTVGESRPIIGLFIKLDDQSAQNYNVFYRAGNGDNQTKWHKNGEITDTFSWDKIETLEIYMEPRDCTLVDDLEILIKNIDKDKCALDEQNIFMKKQQAVNEAQSIRINELTEKLENSEQKNESLKSCMEKLGEDVEQYIQEIDELRTKYNQLEQSFSWRFTKPLRNIGLWWNKRRK